MLILPYVLAYSSVAGQITILILTYNQFLCRIKQYIHLFSLKTMVNENISANVTVHMLLLISHQQIFTEIYCKIESLKGCRKVCERRQEHILFAKRQKVRNVYFFYPAITYGFRGTSEWKFTRAHLQPGGLMRTTHCLPYSSRCQLGTVEYHSRLLWADKKRERG